MTSLSVRLDPLKKIRRVPAAKTKSINSNFRGSTEGTLLRSHLRLTEATDGVPAFLI